MIRLIALIFAGYIGETTDLRFSGRHGKPRRPRGERAHQQENAEERYSEPIPAHEDEEDPYSCHQEQYSPVFNEWESRTPGNRTPEKGSPILDEHSAPGAKPSKADHRTEADHLTQDESKDPKANPHEPGVGDHARSLNAACERLQSLVKKVKKAEKAVTNAKFKMAKTSNLGPIAYQYALLNFVFLKLPTKTWPILRKDLPSILQGFFGEYQVTDEVVQVLLNKAYVALRQDKITLEINSNIYIESMSFCDDV